MFAIGVGEGVDETELRAIASYPDSSHVFQVENYKALKSIEKALAKKACRSKFCLVCLVIVVVCGGGGGGYTIIVHIGTGFC